MIPYEKPQLWSVDPPIQPSPASKRQSLEPPLSDNAIGRSDGREGIFPKMLCEATYHLTFSIEIHLITYKYVYLYNIYTYIYICL